MRRGPYDLFSFSDARALRQASLYTLTDPILIVDVRASVTVSIDPLSALLVSPNFTWCLKLLPRMIFKH